MKLGHAEKIFRNAIIFIYALFIASLYFGLSLRRHHDKLDASASFLYNFPTGSNFVYTYLSYLTEIPKHPENLLGFFLGAFPAIAGITLGYDGAGGLLKKAFFQVMGATAMFIYMVSTRSSGMMGLIRDSVDFLKIPTTLQKNPALFRRQAFLNQVSAYPSFRFYLQGGSTGDMTQETQEILNEIDRVKQEPLSFAHKSHQRLIWISRFVSPLLFFCPFTTIPVWIAVARGGWNHLHPGVGQSAFLTIPTTASNVIFYARSGYQFLDTMLDFLERMLVAMYNPRSHVAANGARITLVVGFFCGFIYLAWKSGAGMGFEAQGVDLKNEFYGLLRILAPIYANLAQFCAGVLVNGTATAAYCINVLPRFLWYNKAQGAFLKWLRAVDTTEENNSLLSHRWIDKRDVLKKLVASDWATYIKTDTRLNVINFLGCKLRLSLPSMNAESEGNGTVTPGMSA